MPFVWLHPRGRAGTTTRSGIVPRIFARTHHARRTPWVAIIFTTLIALLLLVGVGAEGVGTFTNATVAFLLAIALVCWCGLTLRRDLVSRAARATGSPATIAPDQYAALQAQLGAHPDATFAHHANLWNAAHGTTLSQWNLGRAIRRLGWTRKKTLRATERDEAQRDAFRPRVRFCATRSLYRCS
jgi:hypothetical protein